MSKTAITDVISTIYSNKISQGIKAPKAYFRTVSAPNSHSFDGLTKIQDRNLDVFLYHNTSDELDALAKLFEDELDGASGTFYGVEIYGVRAESGLDDQGWSEEHNAYEGRIEVKLTLKRS